MTEAQDFYALEDSNILGKSEVITDRLEHCEDQLNLQWAENRVSDDIRLAYFQIQSAIREDSENKHLVAEYSKVMDRFAEHTDIKINSDFDYLESSMILLDELKELKLVSWERLVDTWIDGGYLDLWKATVEWLSIALDKIWNDFKTMFDFLWPGDMDQLWDGLKNSKLFSDPLDFMMELLEWLASSWVDLVEDIKRDYLLIWENAENKGGAVEWLQYTLGVAVPMVFQAVSPTKLLKVFKILKIAVPTKILAKADKYVADMIGWAKDKARTVKRNLNDTKPDMKITSAVNKANEMRFNAVKNMQTLMDKHEYVQVWKELMYQWKEVVILVSKKWKDVAVSIFDPIKKNIIDNKYITMPIQTWMATHRLTWILEDYWVFSDGEKIEMVPIEHVNYYKELTDWPMISYA